jgi:hypothetical protein
VKLKNTLILLVVFVGLLAFVLFVEKKPQDAGTKPEEKLVAVTSADVQ